MKRTISFLATLMLAFVVAFGFVVDTASAVDFTCTITPAENRCQETLNSGDTLGIRFPPGGELEITYQHIGFNGTAQMETTIGSQVQPPVNLQAGQRRTNIYPVSNFTTARIANKSAIQNQEVRVTVFKT